MTRVDQDCAAADYREVTLNFHRLKFTIAGEDRFEGLPQAGSLPAIAAQIIERNTVRFTRHAEHRVEGAITCSHRELSVDNHQRFKHSVQDSFRKFSLVNGLPDTCAESGHVCKRKHGAHYLVIARCKWS